MQKKEKDKERVFRFVNTIDITARNEEEAREFLSEDLKGISKHEILDAQKWRIQDAEDQSTAEGEYTIGDDENPYCPICEECEELVENCPQQNNGNEIIKHWHCESCGNDFQIAYRFSQNSTKNLGTWRQE